MKRLFAFLGFLLLLKVFLQASEDFEVAEGAVLNVVIDFFHSALGLLGGLFGCLFLYALGRTSFSSSTLGRARMIFLLSLLNSRTLNSRLSSTLAGVPSSFFM